MIHRDLHGQLSRGILVALVLTFLWVFPQGEAQGQSYDPDSILKAEGYITPPDTILSAALAPRWNHFSFNRPNADGSWYLQPLSDGLPHIAEFSKPYHELGGTFIDFAANRSRNLTPEGTWASASTPPTVRPGTFRSPMEPEFPAPAGHRTARSWPSSPTPQRKPISTWPTCPTADLGASPGTGPSSRRR